MEIQASRGSGRGTRARRVSGPVSGGRTGLRIPSGATTLEDRALKGALFTWKHRPERSVELDPRSRGLSRKAGCQPAIAVSFVTAQTCDANSTSSWAVAALFYQCSRIACRPLIGSSEGVFPIGSGVGKQRRGPIWGAIDPGAAILIEPVLNVLIRRRLFPPPLWQGRPECLTPRPIHGNFYRMVPSILGTDIDPIAPATEIARSAPPTNTRRATGTRRT